MWTTLLGFALGGVPEGIDVEDPGPWQDRAMKLLSGPPGCWEVVGDATWSWDYGRWGSKRGDSAFVARFDDGIWSGFVVRSLGQVESDKDASRHTYVDEAAIAPLVGKRRSMTLWASTGPDEGFDMHVAVDGEKPPENQLQRLLEQLGGDVETAWAHWDVARDGVVLDRTVPIGDNKAAPFVKQRAFFPGGATLPTELDTVAEAAISLGGGKIHDASVRIRGKTHAGNLFPTAEAQQYTVSALLGWVQIERKETIRYRSWRACPVAAVVPIAVVPAAVVPAAAPEETPEIAAPPESPPEVAAPPPEGPRVIEFE